MSRQLNSIESISRDELCEFFIETSIRLNSHSADKLAGMMHQALHNISPIRRSSYWQDMPGWWTHTANRTNGHYLDKRWVWDTDKHGKLAATWEQCVWVCKTAITRIIEQPTDEIYQKLSLAFMRGSKIAGILIKEIQSERADSSTS